MKRVFALLLTCVPGFLVAEKLPCTPVPGNLFRPAAHLIPKGLPEEMRVAGAGRTLGVLVPQLPDGHKLLLFRGEKVISETWLAAPKDRPFPSPPMFYLAENGNVVILRSREFLAVYAGGTLTAVVTGENIRGADVTAARGLLFWSPYPTAEDDIRFFKTKSHSLLKEEDWPPLLIRNELDGSEQEVLLRLDEERLRRADGVPLYSALSCTARPDGKLWLVGKTTGDVMLVEDNGHIIRRFELSSALKRPEDDPDIRRQMEEEMRQENEKLLAERAQTDATKRPPKSVEVFSGNKSPLVSGVFARGRDLVLTLATLDPPSGSLLVVGDTDSSNTCFELPEQLRGEGDAAAIQIAVTSDAVWFRKPFGFIPWEDIEALLAVKKEPQASRQ